LHHATTKLFFFWFYAHLIVFSFLRYATSVPLSESSYQLCLLNNLHPHTWDFQSVFCPLHVGAISKGIRQSAL